jgi:hypothetical protein
MLDIVSLPQSVGTMSAHESRSAKYTHLPTSKVIEYMQEADFLPVHAVETKARKADKRGFQKHMIRFRHQGLTALVGDSLPEIVVINSHDGSTGLQLWSGIFRMVCANGLVVASETYGKVSLPHRGDLQGKVIDASYKVIENANKALVGVQEWSKIDMSRMDQLDFAAAALVTRYDDLKAAPVQPHEILKVNRSEDQGSDLWTTFNVVQENLIRGGISTVKQLDNGRYGVRSVRPVRGVGRNVDLNADLWRLADSYAKAA